MIMTIFSTLWTSWKWRRFLEVWRACSDVLHSLYFQLFTLPSLPPFAVNFYLLKVCHPSWVSFSVSAISLRSWSSPPGHLCYFSNSFFFFVLSTFSPWLHGLWPLLHRVATTALGASLQVACGQHGCPSCVHPVPRKPHLSLWGNLPGFFIFGQCCLFLYLCTCLMQISSPFLLLLLLLPFHLPLLLLLLFLTTLSSGSCLPLAFAGPCSSFSPAFSTLSSVLCFTGAHPPSWQHTFLLASLSFLLFLLINFGDTISFNFQIKP